MPRGNCHQQHIHAAYDRWAEIEKKPRHERTPGEDHYIVCMKAWEKQYDPCHMLQFVLTDKRPLTFSADEAWDANELGIACEFDQAPYDGMDAYLGDWMADAAELEGTMWPEIWGRRAKRVKKA